MKTVIPLPKRFADLQPLLWTLERRGRGVHLRAELRRDVWAFDNADVELVFTGGKTGEHSIWLSVSPPDRIMFHWNGYVANNGLTIEVGQRVKFPSRSSPSLDRIGRVAAVTPTRALIEYKFKDGRDAAPKWVHLHHLTIV